MKGEVFKKILQSFPYVAVINKLVRQLVILWTQCLNFSKNHASLLQVTTTMDATAAFS